MGRVPSEQRLFSLVLALVVSPQGLTKRELLSTVHGYAGRSGAADTAARDRQFERDKDQLKQLGINIETRDSPEAPGNNQLTRYRISKTQLEFPAELRFDERELTLLRLAALAWREGSLDAESRRATMRIEALGAGIDAQQIGVAPSLGTREPAAEALQQAIDTGRTVRFDYLLPGREAALTRSVAPLRLHRFDGRWHLIAWDLDRQADRVFLLSRISGAVTTQRSRVDAQLYDRVDAIIAGLAERHRAFRARVAVRRGSIAEARLTARAEHTVADREEPSSAVVSAAPAGWLTLELGMVDIHLLAEELMGFGPDISVVEPGELVELVRAGWQRLLVAHGGITSEESADA